MLIYSRKVTMNKSCAVMVFVVVVLLGGFSSTLATPPHPARIVSGVVNNVVSALFKWLWSLKSTTKTAVSSRSMMKFESGYTVETIFDGSKLGIEPYSVEVTPSGELLVLDSENSNIYMISSSLSLHSRPKLIAGSSEGYTGHIDGRPRDARMNHPKGLTVDDNGNIYIADTMNMAIRKISDAGVTTIAGGKWGQVGGHVDGPSEDAKFSNDFDIVYIPSTCSLLVIDRGNQAIREIRLHDGDCAHQDDSSFYLGNEYLGIVVLVAAGFSGYMLALLHRRVRALFSPNEDARTSVKAYQTVAAYQRPPPKSVRSPLVPPEDEYEKLEEGFFWSLGRLFLNTGSSAAEIFLGLFSSFRRKPVHYQLQQQYQVAKHPNRWPMQESFVIQNEDEPPLIESTTPRPKRTYPFGTKDLDKSNQFKPSQTYASGWEGDYQRQQPQMQHKNQQQYHHMQHSPNTQTYYEQSCENNEIVFGAVQEQDGRRETVVIKAVDYGDPIHNHHNIRPRLNYASYSHGY